MSWFCIPCTYSPERAVESSQTSCLVDTLQSALLNSKSIPEEFCCKDNLTAFFQSFPFGTTLRRLASITPKPQACSTNSERYQGNSPFVAGSRRRARISARPEKEPESPGPVQGFGLTWPASSARFDRNSSSWKIHPCLFPEDSMSCSVTLPRWGTMRGGELSELTTPEHLTSGTGSGFGANWATPTASDMKDRGTPAATARRRMLGKQIGLESQVKESVRQMWPTPTVACATGGQTSRSGDRKGELLLAGAVKLWPTPAARDGHGANSRKHCEETGTGRKHMDQLANAVAHPDLYFKESNMHSSAVNVNAVKSHGVMNAETTIQTVLALDQVKPKTTDSKSSKLTALNTHEFITPTSRDWKGTTKTPNHPNGFTQSLANQVTGGSLNPTWV